MLESKFSRHSPWKFEHKNDLVTDLNLTQGLKEKVVVAFQNDKHTFTLVFLLLIFV